jgi:hypothetical protein
VTTSGCPSNCSCCAGISQSTPRRISNPPGRASIDYRAGTHPEFVASMHARLSAHDYPALRGLKTRDTRDFAIALLDAFAACADVLTFYQERIATESYLRTATERRSLVSLGRLLGHQPRPGVAAETYLAFEMQEGPGAPTQIHLDPGVKVQSIPGPGEEPQTFETVEELDARLGWTALHAERTVTPLPITTDCYLQGTTLNLKPGDALLFFGEEVRADPTLDNWDFRVIETVHLDIDRDLTHVTWSRPLGSVIPPVAPAANPEVHVFRTRAGVFGHNAPLWRAMPLSYRLDYAGTSTGATGSEWPNFSISPVSGAVDLDQLQPSLSQGDWIVLVKPNYTEIYRVTGTSEVSRAEFALSGKVTRATLNGENYDLFVNEVRDTTVFAGMEQLQLARRPVEAPVFGPSIRIEGEHPELAPGKRIALSGPRAHMRVTVSGQTRDIVTAHGTRRLRIDEVLEVLAPPSRVIGGEVLPATPAHAVASRVRWEVRDEHGRAGVVLAQIGELVLTAPPDDAEAVSEVVQVEPVAGATSVTSARTAIALGAPTRHCYAPDQLQVNANVARATHGESVTQVLGSGDASRSHQRFALRHLPLTYLSDESGTGVTSTVQILVNDAPWSERITLFDAGAKEHAYVVRTDGESAATVQFGDGARGGRIPTGRENVLARYRKGRGAAGNVATGQLSQLLTRPLGLVGVTNPVPAEGGVDADSAEESRAQIPRGVRTLGRAVSLRDYEDFARAYPGISKAHVAVLNLRGGRAVVVTVAGPDGAILEPDDPLLQRLSASLLANGDPHVLVRVVPYVAATFSVRMRVKRKPGASRSEVFERIEDELHRAYGIEARAFAEPVVRSQLIALADGIRGVEAVDLEHLYRGTTPSLSQRLVAETAHADASGRAVGAELLTLAEGSLAWLGDM